MNENTSIYFVTSEDFDYGKVICDDQGPAYARRQGWLTVPISQASSVAGKPHIFDNRLSSRELDLLRKHVEGNARTPIFLKVVDPQLRNIENPIYQLVLELSTKRSVSLIGPYHRTGITDLACKIAHRNLYHFLPYAYDRSREISLDLKSFARRQCKLFLSGYINQSTYADRYRMYRVQRRSPRAWGQVTHLKHPGYPDVGQPALHAVTKDEFVAYAGTHAVMWVDGGNDRLELLKFCEAAYAGCVPFGVAAETVPANAASEIHSAPSGAELSELSKLLQTDSNTLLASAIRYREAMALARDPAVWRSQFLSWWAREAVNLANG